MGRIHVGITSDNQAGASGTEALQLKEGDDIEVVVADTRTFEIRRQPSRDEMLSQLKAYRGRLPADFVFDRDEANERGTEIF
ncbi:AbrB family transcriptional regulator [Gammaproteobacteria bacterium LSUCC0112]|nr:AbrB family transcriptional regulator [Gammaproteobacteria bacterium LSUCC0112]